MSLWSHPHEGEAVPGKQEYLEKARTALAARQAWRAVFDPAPAEMNDACSLEPATEGIRTPPAPAPTPSGATTPPTCDRSDESDRSHPTPPVEAEVAWRLAAMRPQVPETGAVPLLIARPDAPTPAGTCLSCGDPLSGGAVYRCRPCVEAAVRAIELRARRLRP